MCVCVCLCVFGSTFKIGPHLRWNWITSFLSQGHCVRLGFSPTCFNIYIDLLTWSTRAPGLNLQRSDIKLHYCSLLIILFCCFPSESKWMLKASEDWGYERPQWLWWHRQQNREENEGEGNAQRGGCDVLRPEWSDTENIVCCLDTSKSYSQYVSMRNWQW